METIQIQVNQDIQAQRQEVIDKLQSGEMVLSFSAIKAFAHSPAHFMAYKIGQRVETPAMKKGTMIHCAILEPDELEKRYSILKKEDLPNPDSDFRNNENKKFKEMFEAKCQNEGKEIITPGEWDNLIAHRDLAYGNEAIAPYLNGLVKKEDFATWEFGGFNWRGVRDGIGKSYVLDLKTVADADPSRTKWLCEQEKYHWQQFLYKQAPDVSPFYTSFNLLVDGNMGISLHEITWSKLAKAESELLRMLDKFKLCIDQNLWHMNYEFWAESNKGYFQID